MALFRIAGVYADINQQYEETAYWYAPYKCDENREADFSISAPDEDIEYLVREGVGITPAIAENMVLCNLFNRRLLRFYGSYIHSSALMFDDKVYLFSGHSGVGKSTLTRRICKAFPDRTKIINDDKPSYRIIDGKCIVFGTPFAGGTDIQLNDSGELGGIVFLEQADENTLTALTPKDSVSLLIEQTPRSMNFSIGDRLLSLYSQIISNYPVYKLCCTDSDDVVLVVSEIFK